MEEERGRETENVYTWETKYERTWENIQEDSKGYLQTQDDAEAYKIKRRRLFERPSCIRLGMMRHMFVIVDCSLAMADKDLKPDRLTCTLKILADFFQEFFDQNPISQLGLITTKNGKAEKLVDLNGNPHVLTKAVSESWTIGGEPSLQNALELAMKGLRHVPPHSSKEAVVVMGALSSCDPGNIFTTITDLSQQSIKCSIIGLAAEVRLCKTIAERTHGLHSVILDESHFKDLMIQHCRPPPSKSNTEASLMKMGFPTHQMTGPLAPCLCHIDQKSLEKITRDGYFCPQCNSKYCELPVECRVCGLTLVKAPHLARSYYHLFPLPTFQETPCDVCVCTGCLISVHKKAYSCPKCRQPFCIDCDLYIHESLHNCPGCTSGEIKHSPVEDI